jgi:hypothetical protein
MRAWRFAGDSSNYPTYASRGSPSLTLANERRMNPFLCPDEDIEAGLMLSFLGEAYTTDQVFEPGFSSEPVKSGIHPDPWHSSRTLKETFLQ